MADLSRETVPIGEVSVIPQAWRTRMPKSRSKTIVLPSASLIGSAIVRPRMREVSEATTVPAST